MKLINRLNRLTQNQKIVLGLLSFGVISIIGLVYFFGVAGGSIVTRADTINNTINTDEIVSPDVSDTQLDTSSAISSDISSSLTPSTGNQLAQLPANIQPTSTPQTQKDSISFYKNDAMNSFALWLMYAIIPAFVSFILIYIYLKRKKIFKKDNLI